MHSYIFTQCTFFFQNKEQIYHSFIDTKLKQSIADGLWLYKYGPRSFTFIGKEHHDNTNSKHGTLDDHIPQVWAWEGESGCTVCRCRLPRPRLVAAGTAGRQPSQPPPPARRVINK